MKPLQSKPNESICEIGLPKHRSKCSSGWWQIKNLSNLLWFGCIAKDHVIAVILYRHYFEITIRQGCSSFLIGDIFDVFIDQIELVPRKI